MTLNIAIIGSTNGTSSQGVIESCKSGELNANVSVILSNKADSGILQRAKKHNIKSVVIANDNEINQQLKSANIDVVLLIGYMKILGAEYVKNWGDKTLNIHPSLLPKYAGGMNTDVHSAVIENSESETGCTVHFVSNEVDGGDIVLQKSCNVLKTDTVESLKKRVQDLESQALIEVIKNWKRK